LRILLRNVLDFGFLGADLPQRAGSGRLAAILAALSICLDNTNAIMPFMRARRKAKECGIELWKLIELIDQMKWDAVSVSARLDR
jgi:hypothetical protein